ncbi:MAG: DUF4190 domain-containing protein, partial [Mycobacterium sp.]
GMGLAARGQVRRGEATNGRVAMAGVVLGFIAVVLSVLLPVALVVLFVIVLIDSDVFNETYQRCLDQHPGAEQFCVCSREKARPAWASDPGA